MLKLTRPILLATLMFVALSSQAIHIKGGWMYYEYLGKAGNGDNRYRIVVNLYRDCAVANPGQNDNEIRITIFNASNVKVADVTAPQSAYTPLEKRYFSECINPKPQVCYVILSYTGTVSLPASPGGYTASFQRCCRINGIVNVLQPSNAFGNTYTIKIPGSETGTGPENNSPKFAVKDTVAVCYDSPFELDYSASDEDGDSLTYAFSGALMGASQSEPTPQIATRPPYNDLPYTGGFSATSPFGSSVTIDPRTGIIKGRSPRTTGEYVVGVSVKEYRNGVYIAETRKELHVNVASCTIAGAELPVRITSCDGYTVSFENLSSSPAINSYYWDFGVTNSNLDTSTQPKPTYTYSDTGVYTAKLVVNKSSTCSDSATTEVRVFPFFNPDFKYNGSCFSNPFQFNDITTGTFGRINQWRWDFGDPSRPLDSSLVKNPTFTYSVPGTYMAKLIVSSDKGCMDTVIKEVKVLDKPLLELPFKDTLICSIDSLMLKAEGIGVFSWASSPSIINTNSATPIVFPKQTTQYTVTLNDRGCVALDTVTVNVLDFITVDAGNDTTICRNDGITLNPVTQGLQFRWVPSKYLSDSSIKNPVATPLDQQVTYRLIANLGKCSATDDITIRTIPYPMANAGNDTSICFSDFATLTATVPVGDRFTWSPTDSMTNPRSTTTTVHPTSTTAYVLNVYEEYGCPKPGTDTVLVTVIQPLGVFAGNDTSIVAGQPLQLNGLTNGTIFNWAPATGLSNPAIANPVLTLSAADLTSSSGKLVYEFQVLSPEGCISKDDLIISLFTTAPSIFVPNAFTPNGDGKNDVIRPIMAGIKELRYFRIYNRWGKLVFESKQEQQGWDGRINGVLQNSNAFVYSCEATDYTGKTFKQDGTFVLIK